MKKATKVSELLEVCLKNHYCNGDVFKKYKSEFMCHALNDYYEKLEWHGIGRDYSLIAKTRNIISVAINECVTLHDHLRIVDKHYAKALSNTGNADCQTCYRIRRKFWRDLIDKLKQEGK